MKNFFVNLFGKIKGFLAGNKDELIKPTVVLLCICIIIPLALAVTNKVTAKRIEELQEKNAVSSMQRLVSADKFTQNVDPKGEFIYNKAHKDGKVIAYIFKTSAKGYGGTVSVMTAVSPEGKIISIEILDAANETPGLGFRITEDKFKDQFKNKSDSITRNDIDTITSATFSSVAVIEATDEALQMFKQLKIEPEDDTPTETQEANPNETEEQGDEAK